MEDRYSFPDSFAGLVHAWNTSVHLRRYGHSTRLVEVPITLTKGIPGVMHTVIATPPARPNRAERGAVLKPQAPYKAQAQQIATMYNAIAQAEARPDLEEQ
jgi:hypothetical protein